MFANKLRELMLEKRITASELARKVWGTTKDNRGYEVARNRDRIGHYLSGKSYPERENLNKIAKVLGVTFEELASTLPAPVVREARSPKDIELVVHATGPLKGAACLSLTKVDLTLENAMSIMKIVQNDAIYKESKLNISEVQEQTFKHNSKTSKNKDRKTLQRTSSRRSAASA